MVLCPAPLARPDLIWRTLWGCFLMVTSEVGHAAVILHACKWETSKLITEYFVVGSTQECDRASWCCKPMRHDNLALQCF